MKNTKKYAIISGFVIFAALFAVGAFAMPGIFGHQNMPSGPSNASIAINSAISGGDFSAFQVAVSTYNITRFENITQEQFNNLVSAYKSRNQMQADMNQTRNDINNAIKNNDYGSWKQAMTDWFNRMTGQNVFNRIVGRYNNSTNVTGWHLGRTPRGQMPGLGHGAMPNHMRGIRQQP
jgi:hypothetical protein